MSGSTGPPLVLVVDDVADIRDTCADYLELFRFRTATAVDGLDALHKAGELHPDVILMDLAMPKLDGCEATRRLKLDARTRDIPILAVTAETGAGVRDRVREVGCAGLMSKPVAPARLVEKIRELLAEPV